MVWFEDPYELLDTHKWVNFFPNKGMSTHEQHNAVMRFSMLFSTIVYLLKKRPKIFYFVFFAGVLSVIVYKMDFKFENYRDPETLRETHKTGECTKPNKTNPFMNVLLSDYNANPTREKACDVQSPKIKSKMEKYFTNELYRSVDDIFDKNYSYRQFYTNPCTTIPNDQEGFAKWLYYTEDKTCKEGNSIACDSI